MVMVRECLMEIAMLDGEAHTVKAAKFKVAGFSGLYAERR